MKKILIAILVLIILIFTYNQYQQYQRYHPENTDIKVSETIDLNYYNKETLYNYYQTLEEVNNYVRMQWSANRIDVVTPKKDNEQTLLAVAEYGKKKAKLNYYKGVLEQSKTLKEKGFTNSDIQTYEAKGLTNDAFIKQQQLEKHSKLVLEALPKNGLKKGEKGAFVYEVQKLLLKKGYKIIVDGCYAEESFNTMKKFQEKNNLYPDGNVNVITLKKLLE